MNSSKEMRCLPSSDGLEVIELDPKNNEEALPTFIYFALSAKSSLTLDPFNQPIQFLREENMRLISITLPDHQEGDPKEAMKKWAENFYKDPLFFDHFIDSVKETVLSLIDAKIIDREKIILAGLSRGGYTALRLAAKAQEFNRVIAFAPLINFDSLPEFNHRLDQKLINTLSLKAYIPKLIGKHIRILIGNRDLRVGTSHAFTFLQDLVEHAFSQGIRSPQVEMIITPSIGHLGHGTSPQSFFEGATWVKKELFSSKIK